VPVRAVSILNFVIRTGVTYVNLSQHGTDSTMETAGSHCEHRELGREILLLHATVARAGSIDELHRRQRPRSAKALPPPPEGGALAGSTIGRRSITCRAKGFPSSNSMSSAAIL
jgi:hypothetical protein